MQGCGHSFAKSMIYHQDCRRHCGRFCLLRAVWAATSGSWGWLGVMLLCLRVAGAQSSYPSVANTWPAWSAEVKGRRVGLVIHASSTVKGALMPEVLMAAGVEVRRIMVPEHGLREDFEAGAPVGDHTDKVTRLPVVSLYGKRKGPDSSHLEGLDLVVFDLQDVGVRFYTYLSTLHYVMEACARYRVPLLVLDRPNANDYTVDGPVLDTAYKSFVGMHPVPVLHGMTLGELARMIQGEAWISHAKDLKMTVLPMEGYRRGLRLQPERPPSPNLRDSLALAWYPTLCFLEGCPVSVGRGTARPFTVLGSPWMQKHDTCFVPLSWQGRAVTPVFQDRVCCGWNMASWQVAPDAEGRGLHPEVLIKLYSEYRAYQRIHTKRRGMVLWPVLRKSKAEREFFQPFFDKLAGGPSFRKALIRRQSAAAVRAAWQKDIDEFRMRRAPYLLYPDL